MIREMFHADTRASEVNSRARELIRTQPEDFRTKVEALTLAADALEGASEAADPVATLEAISRVEMACAACHDTYR